MTESTLRDGTGEPLTLVWLRRDLRLHDHTALARALALPGRIQPVFVFDTDILDALPDRRDRRVEFIWAALQEVDAGLQAAGGRLWVLHGSARAAVPALARQLGARTVLTHEDYEPAALARDQAVAEALAADGIGFEALKDQVIFARSEVMTASGTPFSVFTPYKNAWLKRLSARDHAEQVVDLAGRCLPASVARKAGLPEMPSLADLGFASGLLAPIGVRTGVSGARALLDDFETRIGQYGQARDYPAIKGPSYLSAHMRFGTLSIRQAVRLALRVQQTRPADSAGAQVWLSELIWRDFYFQILHHHPRVVSQAFKPAYDRIQWVRDEALLQAFCEGRTGYPLVDAAMLQLNQTGYMHNRLRMVVASFLTKDLGIDWRSGEAWFARQLLDFDLAANNGGWQWAASSGCDAQPYFRIFNPVSQSERFDPQGRFIKRYLPQLEALPAKLVHAPWLAGGLALQAAGLTLGKDYPLPVVDHAQARQDTLARYQVVR